MDAPVVELPCSLREGIECCRRPQENALQPDRKGFDGLGRCARLSVNFDDMGGVSRTVVFGVACHRTLLQLFDPLDLPLKAVADINGERWVLGVENIPLWATFEGFGVLPEEVLEPIDLAIELLHLGLMVGLSLFNGFE